SGQGQRAPQLAQQVRVQVCLDLVLGVRFTQHNLVQGPLSGLAGQVVAGAWRPVQGDREGDHAGGGPVQARQIVHDDDRPADRPVQRRRVGGAGGGVWCDGGSPRLLVKGSDCSSRSVAAECLRSWNLILRISANSRITWWFQSLLIRTPDIPRTRRGRAI